MMSEMATDKSRFKMPSSVIQEGSELRIKGENVIHRQILAYRIQRSNQNKDQQQKLKKRKARRIKETRRTENKKNKRNKRNLRSKKNKRN